MSKSALEDDLAYQLIFSGLTPVEHEYRFHPTRKWLCDFVWPEHKLILEIEGGTWTQGRHTRGKGFEDDCEKYNEATLMGWRVLRVTGAMVQDGRARDYVLRALGRE